VLDRENVDEVFLTLPMRSHYDAMLRAARLCEERGLPVHVVADLFGLEVAQTSAHQFGGLPIFSLLSSGPMTGLPYLCKIVVDRVGAALLLALLSPLLLASAVAILVTMGRPVFYSQPRVGFHRRVFECLKFRTMERDADQRLAALESQNEVSGPVFKIRDDPRVTRVGRFLRTYSFDEIPNLLNVLRGEMSLVGPRPLPLRDYELLEDWHRKRYLVLPGMTGLWQISGRADLGFDELVRLDFYYLDHWSIWLDVQIMLKTIPSVLARRGAY
jgi:exopolysaccharide biosynthesis polyprenyl glycosylphosphotransferase